MRRPGGPRGHDVVRKRQGAALCYATLRYATLCYTVLYYAMLYYTMLYKYEL